jgi:hypothetical protein
MCTKSGAGLALEAMRLVPQSVGLARLAPLRSDSVWDLDLETGTPTSKPKAQHHAPRGYRVVGAAGARRTCTKSGSASWTAVPVPAPRLAIVSCFAAVSNCICEPRRAAGRGHPHANTECTEWGARCLMGAACAASMANVVNGIHCCDQ